MADDASSGSSANPLVSIIEANDLPNTIRGKAQRVLLRFLAGSLAHPYMREVHQNLDDMDSRTRINMMVADEVGRQAIADPAFMERAKARLLGETIQKQENLEAVIISAHEQINHVEDSDTPSGPETDPSQDWINSFTREAEMASSDELRDRLAKILAGEISKPGTFSRSTIRFIAELDRTLLENFKRALEFRFIDAILPDPSWISGEMFNIGTTLQHSSLIGGVEGFYNKTIKFNADGKCSAIISERALVIESTPNSEIQIKCWLMSKVGLEIANLLSNASPDDQLLTFVKRLDKKDISSILIGDVDFDTSRLQNQSRLWPEPMKYDFSADVSRMGFGPTTLDRQ